MNYLMMIIKIEFALFLNKNALFQRLICLK